MIEKILGSDVCGASLTGETWTGVTVYSWHREGQEYNCGMAVLGLKRVSIGVPLVTPAHQLLCKHALEGVTAKNLSPFVYLQISTLPLSLIWNSPSTL